MQPKKKPTIAASGNLQFEQLAARYVIEPTITGPVLKLTADTDRLFAAGEDVVTVVDRLVGPTIGTVKRWGLSRKIRARIAEGPPVAPESHEFEQWGLEIRLHTDSTTMRIRGVDSATLAKFLNQFRVM